MKAVARKYGVTAVPESAEELVAAIVEVAARLGKHPMAVSYADLRREAGITERGVRKFGPLPTFKKAHFDPEVEPDLEAQVEAFSSARYVRQLERSVGTEDYLAGKLIEGFKAALEKAKPPRVSVKPPRGKRRLDRAVFAVLSDLHFGYTVDGVEVPGGKWDQRTAARRSAMYALEVADFKRVHRKEQRLVVCLNGDIIQGVIHLDDRTTQLVVDQVWTAHWYISRMLALWASEFPKVTVFCQSGNHDRMTYRSPGRARVHKFESHVTLLYMWLRSTFSAQKNVEFTIDKVPISRIEASGNVYALAHGDTDLSIASPGHALNTKAIANQLNALARSPQFSGRLDAAILGHHHAPTFTTLPNGMDLVVNGCMDGVSPYGASIGFRHSHPSQVVFEATEGHPVGDFRNVRLWHGDDEESLDKVIPEAEPWDAK